jgi:DNA-binding transcriptional LysR family regulator
MKDAFFISRTYLIRANVMMETRMNGAAWDDLQLFLNVATEGGLSGAALRTGLSPPTIGRRMLTLERATGRTLFVRSQQGYRLAHDGEVLLEHVRAMQKAASSIADWHKDAFAQPIVSIAADGWLAPFIAEHAMEIRGPADAFRLCCQSRHAGIDMTFRSADVAVVGVRPANGNLAVRPSITMSYAVYRSISLSDREERWISIGTESSHSPADKWVFENHEARIFTWTTAPDMLLRLIQAGAGQGVLPVFLGDAQPDLIREGGIIEALDQPLHIVVNDDDRHRAEVRLAIERLAALLKRQETRFGGTAS